MIVRFQVAPQLQITNPCKSTTCKDFYYEIDDFVGDFEDLILCSDFQLFTFINLDLCHILYELKIQQYVNYLLLCKLKFMVRVICC